MSYDVWLELDAGGPEPIPLGDGWNYTSNVAPMLAAAGLDLGACDQMDAGGVAEGLGSALQALRADPPRFQALNPANGWGSYASLIPALETLQRLCESAPRARVRVWC